VGTPRAWSLAGGRWRPGDDAGADLVWLRVDAPSDLADAAAGRGVAEPVVAALRTHLGAHARTRPRADRLGEDALALVVPTLASRDAADVVTGTVALVVAGDVVLTAEVGEAGVLDGLAERLGEQHPADARTGGLLPALLATLVERALDVEDGLAQAVADLEEVVFSRRTDPPVERLYQLKREIAEARRALAPLSVELPALVADPDASSPGEPSGSGGAALDEAWVRRLVASVDRLDRHLKDHDDLCADMLSAHLALVSVAQNEQMRRISAWAATLAIPTLVGTVYGMNFRHMPELHWTLGYPFALTLMVVLGVAVNLLFRRSGWL